MPAIAALRREVYNPLDRVERIAASNAWTVDRPTDDEVSMLVESDWSDLHLSVSWREDLESLQFTCVFADRIPSARREETGRLLLVANGQLYQGHFDLWFNDGTLLYRDALLLSGGARFTDQQCEALIANGIEACQRYFPAIQFVVWAGKTAEDAIASCLFETMGEA
jgi:hypothetical protein